MISRIRMNSRITAISYCSMVLLGVYISVYQSIINTIAQSYNISSTLIGVIIAMHFAGSFVAPVIFGEISDRVGKKIVIIISFIIFILGLFTVYVSRGLLIIALAIFLIGCSFGVIESMLSAILADLNKDRTNKVISISQMFFCIGAVSGPILALWITRLTGNWRATFLLSAVFSIGLLVVFSKIKLEGVKVPSEPVATKGASLISIKLMKDKAFVILCISIFLYVGIEEAAAFWTTTYFSNVLGAGELGSYALSGYWGSMIIGRYIGSRLEGRYRELVTGGLMISFIALVTALIVKNNTLNLICFVLLGFGFSVVWPALMAVAARIYPESTGTALGIMMTFSAAGGIAVPFFIGTASGVSGIRSALWIIPAITLLLILLQQSRALVLRIIRLP